MNVVALTGRLTSTPELRKTPSGVSVTRFTIAVDRNYTPKGEEKKVDFLDCSKIGHIPVRLGQAYIQFDGNAFHCI